MNDLQTLKLRERLEKLSSRGVLREYAEKSGSNHRTTFRFSWLFGIKFLIESDPVNKTILVKDLFPSVPYRSYLDVTIRRYIADKTTGMSASFNIMVKNCQSSMSLMVNNDGTAYEDSINALLRHINDLFIYLNLHHVDYMHQQFGMPEE